MCRNSDPVIVVSFVLLFGISVIVRPISWLEITIISLCLVITAFKTPPGNSNQIPTVNQNSVQTQTFLSVGSDQVLRKTTVCKIPSYRTQSALGQEFDTLWGISEH